MRRLLWQSEAIRFIIVIFAALLIASVWPFRIWQRNIVVSGGGVRMETSGRVDDAHDLMQRFIAQYDKLGSVTVTIDSVESGRYLDFSLLDENYQRLYHKYTDIGIHDEGEYPIRFEIPVGAQLEVGREYTLFFMGLRSGVHFGLENIPDDASPYITSLYVNDTGEELWHLNAYLSYRQPLTKGISLMIIALILVCALAAERIVSLIAKRRGNETERLVTVGECLRVAFAAPFFALLAVLFVFLLLGRFDYRLTDNAFYFAGLVILGLLGGVGFFVKKVYAGGETYPEVDKITTVIEIIQAISLALAIHYCCDYMNGLYDIFHRIAERKEAISLAVFLVLFLFGRKRGDKSREPVKLNIFGVCAVIFFALLVIFRNGRFWGVTLAAFFALGLVCYRFSGRRERWLKVLTAGLTLNFVTSVLYCLLHRYFAAFVSGRFPFVFHTVTVTAEYMTMMGAVAFVLLLAAVKRLPDDMKPVEALRSILPEFVFFGTVSSYAIFTASRTAFLALGFTVIVLLVVMGAGKRGRGARGFAFTVLAAAVMFPPVFALQRMIPPMVGEPEYMEIEDATPDLRGWTNWDSRYLMSVERFSAVFLDKIAGMEGASYNYPEDRFNYGEDGEIIYPEVSSLLMRGGGGNPAASTLIEDGSDADRVANGRLTIWKSYFPYINLTGHSEMGVPLPNGEIAVHAHNVYLQVIHDNGLITGVYFIVFMLFAAFACAVYGRMRPGVSMVPLAVTAGFMVAGVSEWNFQFSNMMTAAMVFSWIPVCFKKKDGKKI